MLREMSMEDVEELLERGVGVLQALLEHRQAVREPLGPVAVDAQGALEVAQPAARSSRSRSRSIGARDSSSITRSKSAVPSDSSRKVRPTASKRSSR